MHLKIYIYETERERDGMSVKEMIEGWRELSKYVKTVSYVLSLSGPR